MRDEIFSKFKDYNKELEKILETKDFKEDTKNLLLSMFYKIEISYNDYATVKPNSQSKQEYLENILENIRNIQTLKLIKPTDEDFEEFKENGLYQIDLKLKKINVIANEVALLSAILELNDFQIHLSEKYNLIRNAMPYLLNTAYDMENTEVLRDFNAWSWNTVVNEIKDIRINLVYQVLKIILNMDLFSNLKEEVNYVDVMEVIQERLESYYPPKVANKVIELFSQIAIMIYIEKNENEKKRLKEEKELLENELQKIKDKKRYIEELTEIKKILKNDLKQLDLIINNKNLLYEEYEKRNQKLPEYRQFFSLSHLVEKLQKERKKNLEKINDCNQKLEPKRYVEDKQNLQKEFQIIKLIHFEDENNVNTSILKFQHLFLKEILPLKIEKIEARSDFINLLYELRYYCFIPYSQESIIAQKQELQAELEIIEEIIIKKLFEKKWINVLSSNLENDIAIVKNIFHLKMINLENIYIEIKEQKGNYSVFIYDEKDTLEEELTMSLEFHKKDKIKLNRKIKLFI